MRIHITPTLLTPYDFGREKQQREGEKEISGGYIDLY